MKRRRIAVTGIGAVTNAGPNVRSLIQGLEKGARLFAEKNSFELAFPVSVGIVGSSGHPTHDFEGLDSPTGRLCLQAARECVNDVASRGGGKVDGLVLGTSTGGQNNNEAALFSLLDGAPQPQFNYRKQGAMAAASRLVAADLDIVGPVQTVSTACTSASNAIALGAAWIQSQRCDRVLVGGGDALCHTTISGFNILQLTGPKFCTPFGENRPGMTLGEGAGFLMLEDMDGVRAEGREILAELCGFGMSSDAHHMTAPLPDGGGAEQAMLKALKMSRMSPEEVDHVNAHGTGTELNDAAEAQAISRVFGSEVPVMSCKGLIGHTLGGAGGVEAVVSVVSVRTKRGFENIGASEASEDCPVTLVPKGGIELRSNPVVISNSFAFGGNNCALVFRAGPEGEICD